MNYLNIHQTSVRYCHKQLLPHARVHESYNTAAFESLGSCATPQQRVDCRFYAVNAAMERWLSLSFRQAL